MYLETTCTEISIDRWNELMKDAKPCNYEFLVSLIHKKMPYLYNELMLQYYNPWAGDCCETKTHYILVHSAIEYFIHE